MKTKMKTKMKLSKILLLMLLSLAVISCKNDDDNNTIANTNLSFNFTQNWDGTPVSLDDFENTVYTTQIGQELTITRIRYLISRIVLTNSNDEQIEVNGYKLIDMSDPSTFSFNPNIEIPEGEYTISFIYGFNEEDNITGAYADLNTAIWNWPDMLGGGYHFMQFEGMYNVNTNAPSPFNYHNGTARVSEGVFEQNYVTLTITTPITISDNNPVNINMNIAEWFKNPYTWDLDVYNTTLMPNYDAQKLMHQNASTVFSVSTN